MSFFSAIPAILGIVDKFVPDSKQAAKLKHELEMKIVDQAGKQLEVNKAEAAHRSVFVAGWRPAVGWTCAVSFAYHFVGQPILNVVLALYGIDVSILPVFDISSLLTVLMGMLGLGSLRTYEKKQGLTK